MFKVWYLNHAHGDRRQQPITSSAYIIVALATSLYRMRTMTTAYFEKIQIREE